MTGIYTAVCGDDVCVVRRQTRYTYLCHNFHTCYPNSLYGAFATLDSLPRVGILRPHF